jgi:hypothetical protein
MNSVAICCAEGPSWTVPCCAVLALGAMACGGGSSSAGHVDATTDVMQASDVANGETDFIPNDAPLVDAADASNAGTDSGVPDSSEDAAVELDGPCLGYSPCPPSVPEAGSACNSLTFENTTCEYGDDPRPHLNAIAQCMPNVRGRLGQFPGAWQISLPPDASVVSPLPSGCPATLAEAMASTACAVDASLPAECFYPGGTCTCYPGGDSGPTLVCLAAGAACPAPRPRIGTVCADNGSIDGSLSLCRYTYDCAPPTGTLSCACGIWISETLSLCPM